VIINNDFFLANTGVSNSIDASSMPRHRWYSYKESFSPSLVNSAINCFEQFDKSKDLILDPFNGSGTVTLFSSINGYKSSGFEVNPFSSFISRTKQIKLSAKAIDILRTERDNVIKQMHKEKKSPLLKFSTFSEISNPQKWLFNSSVLNSFESGKAYLYKNIKNSDIRNLLKLGLINGAMNNSNARKDGKCLRYKKDWANLNYSKDSLINSFNSILDQFIEDISESNIIEKSYIINGDSRRLLQSEKGKFKLCITSPPYLNSFDYTDIYRPELFLGNFISNSQELLILREKTLRSHINHLECFDFKKSFGVMYDNILTQLRKSETDLWSQKIPSMIQAYFEDMRKILQLLRKKANKDSQLWLIVGNSAYADIEIPTDLILAEIGTKNNWYLKEIGVLRNIHKRGSKYSPTINHLRESVIIFSSNL